MQESMVSVIVPVFNAEQYLTECLDSLLSQTYRNLEIILIDDGSGDSSLVLCQDYAKSDKRVRVLSQENRGVSAARNRGIAEAKGKYITFIDADDWVEPEHVQQLVLGLQGGKYDCSVCGYWLEYSQHKEQRKLPCISFLSADQAINKMFSTRFFQGFLCNKLFKVSIIRLHRIECNEMLYYLEDFLFCATYFFYSKEVYCIDFSTYHYRQHKDSAVWRSVATAEWFERRMTAILAWNAVEKFCRSSRSKKFCAARRQMEYAEILWAQVENKEVKSIPWLVKLVRQKLLVVLFSPLEIRQKMKYIATAIFPQKASSYIISRKRKYL